MMLESLRPLSSPALPEIDEDETELRLLKEKIQRERGFHCELYKDKCLRRRIRVRMRARGQHRYGSYAELLDKDNAEYDRLLDALTINVTKFFRNAEMWRVLESEVLPELMRGRRSPLRVWSAGCSSGEEPHSVAILLHEWARSAGGPSAIRDAVIEATDIDRRSLILAQRADYSDLSLLETPTDIRQRWFSAGPPFRLHEEARRMVRFRRHDLISDTPRSGYHLILCRNVIIYFDREIQTRIFQCFFDALVPGGYLVLGKVETLLGASRTMFQPVNARERIFRKPAG